MQKFQLRGYLLLSGFLFLSFVGCKKASYFPPGGLKDTVLYLTLNSSTFITQADSLSQTYLASINFAWATSERFFGESNFYGAKNLKIRYVGSDSLMGVLNFMDSRLLIGTLNEKLQGQPLFVVTDLSGGEVYDSIFAGAGPIQITEYYEVWRDEFPFSGPQSVVNLFKSYISGLDTLNFTKPN